MEGDQILCQMCLKNDSLYKCPKCGKLTCSLQCCRRHKIEENCSGKRDKAVFVAMKDFGDDHLRSDFHFLEDVLNRKGTAKRTFVACGGNKSVKRSKVSVISEKNSSAARTPIIAKPSQNLDSYDDRARLFSIEAHNRGIKLLLMPQGMTRRMQNSSYYDIKKKTIFWKITLVFLATEEFKFEELFAFDPASKGHRLNDHIFGYNVVKVDEHANLLEFISSSFESQEMVGFKKILQSIFNEGDIHCLLRIVSSPANDPLFAELSPHQSISEVLEGHSIIEHPVFYICNSSVQKKFRLLVSDVSEENSFTPPPSSSSTMMNDAESSSSAQSLLSKTTNPKQVTFQDDLLNMLCSYGREPSLRENEGEEEMEEGKGMEEEEEMTPTLVGGAGDDDLPEKAYEEFLRVLNDLQNQDVSSLQAILQEIEEGGGEQEEE